MRASPKGTAVRYVAKHFPDCAAAFLGGSAGKGLHNERSDLDVVIVMREDPDFFRKVQRFDGWTVECVAVTLTNYRELFDEGIQAGNPSLQRMIAEGIVIVCGEEGRRVREEAERDLASGPMPWSNADMEYARYRITDQLEDLKGASRPVEQWFAAGQAVTLLCEFLLRANRQWSGEGKYLYRCVAAWSPETAARLEAGLRSLYVHADEAPFVTLCKELLAPYGGLLMEGFEE